MAKLYHCICQLPCFASTRLRMLARQPPDMKLPVIVLYPDATLPDKTCEFKFNLPVGAGGQSIKWLALSAAQRFRGVRVVSAEFHNAIGRNLSHSGSRKDFAEQESRRTRLYQTVRQELFTRPIHGRIRCATALASQSAPSTLTHSVLRMTWRRSSQVH